MLQVVGEAVDVQELWAQLVATCPDLLLLDWELPGHKGTDVIPALHLVRPDLAVVVLSGRGEARRLALSAGADAFVSKTDPPERLLETLARHSQGSNRNEDQSGNSDRRSSARPGLY